MSEPVHLSLVLAALAFPTLARADEATASEDTPDPGYLAGAWSLRHVDVGLGPLVVSEDHQSVSILNVQLSFAVNFPVIDTESGLALGVEPGILIAGYYDSEFGGEIELALPAYLTAGYGLNRSLKGPRRFGGAVGFGIMPAQIVGSVGPATIVPWSMMARVGWALEEPLFQNSSRIPPVQLAEVFVRYAPPAQDGGVSVGSQLGFGVHLQGRFPRTPGTGG